MSREALPLAPGDAELRQLHAACIHCGLCLPACPTYELLGDEADSPRGRIALIGAAARGELPAHGAWTRHLDRCLGCRACETACPSGVRYGALLERTRAHLRPMTNPAMRWLQRAMLRLLGRRRLLRAAARVGGWAHHLGLVALARRLPAPSWLRAAAGLAPAPRLAAPRIPGHGPLPARGARRGSVALFRGCVQDAFLGAVGHATARVLQRWGLEVHVPTHQTCCGALAAHAGETDLAERLLDRNRRAFGSEDVRSLPIVVDAGGCAASLHEHGGIGLGERVMDLSSVLLEHLPAPAMRLPETRVTLLDSCHLRHGLGVSHAPRALLESVHGLQLRPMPHPDRCCGSAGVYNLGQPGLSHQVLTQRMADVRSTGAQIVVVLNPGCQLQLLRAVREAGLSIEVLHLSQLLLRALRHATGARP